MLLLLPACSGAGPAPRATASPGSSPALSAAPSPSPTASATARPAAGALAACPQQPARADSLPVLHRGGSPDDLAVAPDGALWVSDAETTVLRLVDGAVTRRIDGLREPEGMVVLPNGDLVVAEQATQRILTVHPDDTRATLLQLPSAGAGQLGVDGIGLDPGSGRILVPDSPHGTLLSVAPSGGAAARLAGGLGRPVGVVSNGVSTWIAAENDAPRGLLVLQSSGRAVPLGHLAQLDDIVAAGGLLYVTDLRGMSVHAVDPQSGADRVIATGLLEPQGLALLPNGALAVADSKRGVVQMLQPCGG